MRFDPALWLAAVRRDDATDLDERETRQRGHDLQEAH